MKLEKLVEQLRGALGEDLVSVVEYGSTITDEYVAKRSGLNVLAVTKDLSVRTLRALQPTITSWQKEGERAPLLFTRQRLIESADVFPLELFDIRAQHRLLHGEDCLAELDLKLENLRWQLESESKGKLIALREGYFASAEKPKHLLEYILETHGSWIVLMRGMLRLVEKTPPADKRAVVELVGAQFGVKVDIFGRLEGIKQGIEDVKASEAEALFEAYLLSAESIVDTINHHLPSS